MLEHFFIYGPIPANAETGTYIYSLVLISYIVAVFGSYAGLTLATELYNADTRQKKRTLHWMSAIALGTGIWSMHFIGMLAYKMRMLVSYDPGITALSGLIAIVIAYFVAQITQTEKLSIRQIVPGAILLGIGICAMHYTGMAAMHMRAALRYTPGLFFLSVLIAMTASGAALWIIFTLGRHTGRWQVIWKILAALVMGAAICGMHYTGMAAAVFIPFPDCRFDANQDFMGLAAAVTTTSTVLLVLLTFAISRRLFLVTACSIFFALPLVFVVDQAVSRLSDDIHIAQREEYGAEYHYHLMNLLLRLQEARGLTNIVDNGDASFAATLRAKREDVQRALAAVDITDSSYGDKLSVGSGWEDQKGKILDLMKAPKSSPPADEFKKYSEVISSLINFMSDITDKADLSADPQPDSDYLVDAAMKVEPNLVENIGQMRGQSSGLLASGKLPPQWSNQDIRELQTLYDSSAVDDRDIQNALGRAQHINKDAARYLKYHDEVISPALANFRKQYELMIFDRTNGLSVPASFKLGTDLIARYETLYGRISRRFSNAVQQRHEKLQSQKNLILYSSTVAFLGFIALIVFLYHNLAKTEEARQESVQKEKQLYQKTALLDTVLDNMPLAVFAKDVRDNYRWIVLNRKAQDLFCMTPENTLGKIDWDLFPKEEADFFHATDVRVMAGHKLVDIDSEPVTTPKGTFTAHTLKMPIYENGQPAMLLGMLEDVTDKIKAQEELRRAKEEAEVANVAKSEFLANMSHELRTPLNSILGMIRLLTESKLTEDQRGLAETAFRSSVNLLDIVNDILDLSKIEAGEVELERIGFDPQYVINSTAQTLGQIAREKRLTLVKNYEHETFPYVLGDPSRFSRIFVNLIGNAIKYTDEGHVEVKASCAKTDDAHIELHCEIMDTGVGIAKEKLGKIFDKFVQGDASMTRRFGGTGLGLAITKQLVELMGGKIGVESELGKGSTFWFKIPFEITDKLHEEKRIRRRKSMLGTVSVGQARILVGEDHPMNQLLIRKLLQRFGVGYFKIVDNGAEILNLSQEVKWDVILMDCHMPEKNGYDTTKEIRDLEKTTGVHVPIVAMTANAMVGDREKCLRYGMDEYVSKPIDVDELKEVLGQWIRFDNRNATGKNETAAGENFAAVNLTQLRTFTEGNKETEREFIAAFVTQSDKNLEILKENRVGGECKAWVDAAHMFKGGAGGVGAGPLSLLCSQAQHMEGGTAEDRAALYAQIESEYGCVKDKLREMGLLA